MDKNYTIRNIQAPDVFCLIKIIRKIGVKNFTKAMGETKENNAQGFAILDVLIDRIAECEEEVYEFLARLTGLNTKDIAKLDADVFMSMIYEVVEHPKFVDFLKVALKRAG